MPFKIIYVINQEDNVIAYPVVTFSFFQHHGTGRYLSLPRLAPFGCQPAGGQLRGRSTSRRFLVVYHLPAPHTHSPSTRIFASKPLNRGEVSDEKPKHGPQVMSGEFENFPTAFSWGFCLSPRLEKISPARYRGDRTEGAGR